MAKKLKTYETSLGFFDLAIAAPSMKAALEACGADSNLFHQGAAKQSEDLDVVAATMAKPGVVLKRPVGSNGPFEEKRFIADRIEGLYDEVRTGRPGTVEDEAVADLIRRAVGQRNNPECVDMLSPAGEI
jgi:hypothetical protein